MGKDNLTNGPMARHFRALALPAAFGMLFATLYNIVDVYYAGLLSTDAQAGLAIGYQAIFILMALDFGPKAYRIGIRTGVLPKRRFGVFRMANFCTARIFNRVWWQWYFTSTRR